MFGIINSHPNLRTLEDKNQKKGATKMARKIMSLFLAVLTVMIPFQGEALAVVITAQGQVTLVSTFSAPIKKVSDNTAATQINFASGTGVASGDAYIDISFNDNNVGFQAVLISSDNRNASASPKYSGIAQGSGLVGQTDTSLVVPLKWMVSDALITGGYTFTGAAGEFFVQDKLQGTTSATQNPTTGATACNDANKNSTCETGEFTEYNGTAGFQANLWTTGAATNRCAANTGTARFEGVDWDGDCYDGAKPYDNGFGSIVFGIASDDAELSGAAGSAVTVGRMTTDGNVKVYVGADYSGANAQVYKTNRLTVELATIA
jgi:hypothetical protein